MDQTRRQILAGMAALVPCAGAQVVGSASSSFLLPTEATPPSELRDALVRTLGKMPARPTPAFRTLESVKLASGRRDKIEYLAEPSDPLFHTPPDLVRAYLFVPETREHQSLPAIIAIHQDGPQSHIGKSEPAGLAGDPSLFYGLELFQRGYVVLCPDRFYHAERRRVTPNDMTSINPDRDDQLQNHWVGQLLLRGRNGYGKEVYDLMVATDILRSLEYVDAKRIGAIGHSAGGNALVYFLFADERVHAGVSSCGLFDMCRFFDENAPMRRLAATALPNLAEVGSSADYLALIAPRPMLLTRGLWEWGRENSTREEWSKNHVEETKEMVARAQGQYARLKATEKLSVLYFEEDGGNHAFPPHVRQQVYEWLDQQLGNTTAAT